MIAVFCFEGTWKGWSAEAMVRELDRLGNLGIDTIVTETVDPPHDLIRGAGELGLRTFVSVPCFSAHGWPELSEGLDLRPVQADGQPRGQMEWYTGLIPTHEGYNRDLLERIRRIATARPAGILLDFIRWPLHWELELRVGAPEPGESSFDRRSIEAFSSWLDDRGRDDPTTIGALLSARELTGPLRERWTDFKCDVITRVACAAAEVVRAEEPAMLVGAFIVPGTEEERRRLLGQDVAALGACLDLLLPMTYHGILHRPVEWVGQVTTDVQERSRVVVIPVVQVTAEPAVAGPWDWGREVSPGECGRVVEAALGAAPGVILFPFEGLDAARGLALSAILGGRQDA
jgi:hypothetical protein